MMMLLPMLPDLFDGINRLGLKLARALIRLRWKLYLRRKARSAFSR